MSSSAKELFLSSACCRQVRRSGGLYLETCFLLKSCWQHSIRRSSKWIQYQFGHRGFSNGWDSWLPASSSPSPSFSHAYYIILHWLKTELYNSTAARPKNSLRYGRIYIWPFFYSEIPPWGMKRLTNGCFSFLYWLFSNKQNIYIKKYICIYTYHE